MQSTLTIRKYMHHSTCNSRPRLIGPASTHVKHSAICFYQISQRHPNPKLRNPGFPKLVHLRLLLVIMQNPYVQNLNPWSTKPKQSDPGLRKHVCPRPVLRCHSIHAECLLWKHVCPRPVLRNHSIHAECLLRKHVRPRPVLRNHSTHA